MTLVVNSFLAFRSAEGLVRSNAPGGKKNKAGLARWTFSKAICLIVESHPTRDSHDGNRYRVIHSRWF